VSIFWFTNSASYKQTTLLHSCLGNILLWICHATQRILVYLTIKVEVACKWCLWTREWEKGQWNWYWYINANLWELFNKDKFNYNLFLWQLKHFTQILITSNSSLTWPASISCWNFLAAAPDVVNIAAPLPYLKHPSKQIG